MPCTTDWLRITCLFILSLACNAFSPTPSIQNIGSSSRLSKSILCYSNNDEDDQKKSTTPRPTPQRRFRSNASGNSSKNRSQNQQRYRSSGGYERKRNYQRSNQMKRSISHPIFTKTSMAPALEQLKMKSDFSDNQDQMSEEQIILSPSVIENNSENCEIYICGELPVTYTNDSKTLQKWLASNCIKRSEHDQHTYLGFDVEATPNVPWRKPANREFMHRPATVQLSTPYSSIVVHLTESERSTGMVQKTSALKPLEAMLKDPTILKVGAGIDDDCLELFRWKQNLATRSRFDIAGIGSDPEKRGRVGLQKLVRAIVGVELAKSKKIAMSDWSMVPLSRKQLVYASRDAWAGAAVMANLRNYESMHIDSIAQLIRGREREMHELDSRARTRKKAREERKEMLRQAKEMATFLYGEGRVELDGEKLHGKEYNRRLFEVMPPETKAELDRLQNILDETRPDSLLFFDADELGLDFSFVE